MAILLRPNPEAFNFLDAAGIARTEANGSIIIATCQLTTDLKNYGLWNKMKAVYPFVGGTSGSHKFNLKDPRDLDAAFRLTFSGSWIHSSTGATPDGTTAYADTKLNPNTIGISAASIHISNYLRTNSNGLFCDMGAYGGDPADYQVSLYARLTDLCFNDLGAQSQTRQTYANTDSTGYYVNIRTANNVFKMFKSNVLKATNTNTNTATIANKNVFLSANNEATIGQFSNRQTAFASIGDGLTDTDASNLYTAVQRFQTTLGRQV